MPKAGGLKEQDLRALKDQLLVEVSELLGVGLFEAEALLRLCSWNKDQVLQEWLKDSRVLCKAAGIALPSSISPAASTPSAPVLNSDEAKTSEGKAAKDGQVGEGEVFGTGSGECGICGDEPEADEPPLLSNPCQHFFCQVRFLSFFPLRPSAHNSSTENAHPSGLLERLLVAQDQGGTGRWAALPSLQVQDTCAQEHYRRDYR